MLVKNFDDQRGLAVRRGLGSGWLVEVRSKEREILGGEPKRDVRERRGKMSG